MTRTEAERLRAEKIRGRKFWPGYNSYWTRIAQERRKAAGLCRRCGVPRIDKFVHCANCRAYHREHNRRYKQLASR
jgi:hypothetical protein